MPNLYVLSKKKEILSLREMTNKYTLMSYFFSTHYHRYNVMAHCVFKFYPVSISNKESAEVEERLSINVSKILATFPFDCSKVRERY